MYILRKFLKRLADVLVRLARFFYRTISETQNNTSGNTLISDFNNHRVIEVNNEKVIVWQYGITGISGHGNNYISFPRDAQRLSNGNTLILDSGNHRVIEVTPDKSIVWQYAPATFNNPGWIQEGFAASRLTNGNTLIADSNGHCVMIIDSNGIIVWQYGTRGTSGSADNQLHSPYDAKHLTNGNILIADSLNSRVIEVDLNKTVLWQYGTTDIYGSGDNQLNQPSAAVRLPSGNTLIADTYNNRVIEVTPGKTIVWQYTVSNLSPLDARRLSNGNTLISSSLLHSVYEVDTNGNIVWQYGTTGTGGSHDNLLRNPMSATRIETPLVQPDLMVRILQENGQPRNSSYIGAGIHNTDAANQTTDLAWWISEPEGVTFALKLFNGGNITDNFIVTAVATIPPPQNFPWWELRFFNSLINGIDITDEVTSSGWISQSIEAGQGIEFSAQLFNRGCGSGQEIEVLVTVKSVANNLMMDSVKLRAKAPIIL